MANVRIAVVLSILAMLNGGIASAAENRSIAELIEQLRDPDTNVRLHAAAELGDRGKDVPPVRSELILATRDPHKMVRFYAVEALGRIVPRNEAIRTHLGSIILGDSSWIVARKAAQTILETQNPFEEKSTAAYLFAKLTVEDLLWYREKIRLYAIAYRGADDAVTNWPSREFFLKEYERRLLAEAAELGKNEEKPYFLPSAPWRELDVRSLIDVVPALFHRDAEVRKVAAAAFMRIGGDPEKAAEIAQLYERLRADKYVAELQRKDDETQFRTMMLSLTNDTKFSLAAVAEIIKRDLPGFEPELIDVICRLELTVDAADNLIERLYQRQRKDFDRNRPWAVEIIATLRRERKLNLVRDRIVPQLNSSHPLIQARALAELAYLDALHEFPEEAETAIAKISVYLQHDACFEMAEAEQFAALLVADKVPDNCVPQLEKLLKSSDETIREVACQCFERLGPRAKEALPALWVAFNGSENSTAAFEAIAAVRRDPEDTPPRLSQLARDLRRKSDYDLLLRLRKVYE